MRRRGNQKLDFCCKVETFALDHVAIPFRLQSTLDKLFKCWFRQVMSMPGKDCKIFVDIYN